MLTGTGFREKTASTEWSYSINYGPEGEEHYANLMAPGGVYVSNIRTHHAKAISEGMNALASKDAEIARQAVVIDKYRQAQDAEWQPISTCPLRDSVDLWCVYGGEEFAQFDGGASIGFLVSGRFKTEEYGFFGNQSNEGVPRRDGPDFVPVAWRYAVPRCPATLIAEALVVPLTCEDAIAALTHPDAKSGGNADVL